MARPTKIETPHGPADLEWFTPRIAVVKVKTKLIGQTLNGLAVTDGKNTAILIPNADDPAQSTLVNGVLTLAADVALLANRVQKLEEAAALAVVP